jgi:glycosyltransferase involved in cell wall biosynthesis
MGSEQKKIVIVFNSLKIGGIETKIIDICNYYSRYKETTVFLLLKNKNGELLPLLPKNIIVKTPFIKNKKLKTFFFPLWLAKQYTLIKPNLVITFGNFSSISGVLAKNICKIKTKLIISEDSSITDQIEMEKFSRLRFALLKITYPLADKIIVLTKVGKEKLSQLIPKFKSKILIIPNWLPQKFSSENNNLTKKREIDALFLGRFELQKNPLLFLEIAKLLVSKDPLIKIYMVGSGSLSNKIADFIQKNKLCNNITIKGPTINPSRYLQRSKFLILSSNHEGFPLTILESLSCGCIPICRYLPEINTFLKKYSRLIIYKDISSALAKFEYLSKNQKKYKEISDYYQNKIIIQQKINFKKTINVFEK